jgi:hypothetical protein
MKAINTILLAALAAPLAAADDPPPSLLGSGLLTLQDTRTLPPKRLTLATTLHNRDRDPLGIDVFDYSLAFTAGLTPHVEAYGRGVFSRVVVVPDRAGTSPVLPPPPLDLVLPRGGGVPERPYYSYYSAFPYANGRGDQRFSDLVPGDLVLGAKVRIRDGQERRAAVALSGELKMPLTRRQGALQSGAGTGGVDATIRATSEWRVAGLDLVATAAFTRVGAPYLADRILMADPDGADVVSEPLHLPDRIELAGGARRAVSRRVALVAEAVVSMEISGGTQVLDSAPPLDVLAGFQTHAGHARLTGGLIYHGRSLPTGRVRGSPLAGYVDLSRATQEDIRQYLNDAGLGGAAFRVRPGVQIVAPARAGAALPEGARLIPDTYTIVSEHQVGFVLVLGWAF